MPVTDSLADVVQFFARHEGRGEVA
jgi:hypothetical protein